jgi:tetratricopeptide (TPR) repeat protein
VNLSIKHFQGEEAFAQHVKDLAINALPIIEDLYGVPYGGPPDVRMEERGKVATLGYEGIADCGETFCTISVTPIADDYTILHELGHLWSNLYAKRWLQEGFADFVAKETAGRLPGGLVNGSPLPRPQPTAELQLEDWGGITPGASLVGPEREVESAGYYRSERLLVLLQVEAGLDALKKANAAIAATGNAADSRRFMDALEDGGGGNNDDLFQEWVFQSSIGATLAERRQARDRFSAVVARATGEGLSDTVTGRVWNDLSAWRFEDAQARLDEAEDLLTDYDEMKVELTELRSAVEAAGLIIGPPIEEDLNEWHFKEAAEKVDQAAQALAAYREAQEKVDQPRNPWEEFGLLGSDPDDSVREAGVAFNAGDYEDAAEAAADAISAVDGAPATAARRVLMVAGAAAAFSMLVLLGVWYTRVREGRAGRFG